MPQDWRRFRVERPQVRVPTDDNADGSGEEHSDGDDDNGCGCGCLLTMLIAVVIIGVLAWIFLLDSPELDVFMDDIRSLFD